MGFLILIALISDKQLWLPEGGEKAKDTGWRTGWWRSREMRQDRKYRRCIRGKLEETKVKGMDGWGNETRKN